ncbi:hypothetical protein D3C87_2063690 [compost metagenome]
MLEELLFVKRSGIAAPLIGVQLRQRGALPVVFGIGIYEAEAAVKSRSGIDVPYIDRLHRYTLAIV